MKYDILTTVLECFLGLGNVTQKDIMYCFDIYKLPKGKHYSDNTVEEMNIDNSSVEAILGHMITIKLQFEKNCFFVVEDHPNGIDGIMTFEYWKNK